MSNKGNLKLGLGFTFHDLFSQPKLKLLTEKFYKYFQTENPDIYEKFSGYNSAKGEGYSPVDISKIIIDSAKYLENFLADLFGINNEIEQLRARTEPSRIITEIRKDFIQRRVFKKAARRDPDNISFEELNKQVQIIKNKLFPELEWKTDEERATAVMISVIIEIEKQYKIFIEAVKTESSIPENSKAKMNKFRNTLLNYLDSKVFFEKLGFDYRDSTFNEDYINYDLIKKVAELIESWSYKRFYDEKEHRRVKDWVLYKMPLDMDFFDLVHNKKRDPDINERMSGKDESLRKRDGFKLTDGRYNTRQVMWEVEYCIFCHERDKDSCSKGLHEKDGTLKKNPLGISLAGCPLDEKISEMHYLKNEGRSLAALSLIMIDNPMCPGTGHRICNDCMKGCIYQKQEPVNIPQIETQVLTDVLSLPYGFEIYSLMTRWNPLNVHRPYELPYNGKNVMVVGLGPAGYTLSHYLLNEGFGVVGIDGLKIEKVHKNLTGYVNENGEYIYPEAVKNFEDIKDELNKRIFLGFGGVSEYGITVRWDKNFLKVVYLTLERRKFFKLYDGIRFGGTIEIDDAWKMGFDHIAIASGAGKPTLVKMKNNLARGMRMASDFLMALQLTGAAKKDSIANLQLQLPAVVIGGGLTAIDTATEAAAYYPVQVEKFLDRYEIIKEETGDAGYWKMLDPEETIIAKKFLEHGREIKAERKRAAENNEEPDFVPLMRKWGGVTIAYRKTMQDSPAYRLNHEEVIKSLEEGIYYWEKLSPVESVLDQYGSLSELIFIKQDKSADGKWIELDEKVIIPAKSVLVAAGTSPNVIYEREHEGTFELDEWKQFFRTYRFNEGGNFVKTEKNETGFFTSYRKDGKYISVYGDNHPVYAGNVVKAMASARDGYRHVVNLFKDDIEEEQKDSLHSKYDSLVKYLDEELIAVVHEVNILTPNIVEVVVKSPLAAKKFQPGQFYRLQNYETEAYKTEDTTLLMEGLALTGAWVDKEKGLLSMIVLEMWGSSRLVRNLPIGQRVVVMGPTGSPTHIPENETVLLAGGGLGNAVLFSIAKAMKENGNRVIYFAGYRNSNDLFKQDEVEEATDQVIWSNDTGEKIKPRRMQDKSINANIVQAIAAYAKGELNNGEGRPMYDLRKVDRIIAIGSDRMMNAIKEARFGVLQQYLQPKHTAIGSINSTMQCMMKEVCAQCLQRHVDPVTGKEYFVFSCFNQDQMLDAVDFGNLNSRLKNNSVVEKLSKFWLDMILENI